MSELHVASTCGLPMYKTDRHRGALTFLQDSCCSHSEGGGKRGKYGFWQAFPGNRSLVPYKLCDVLYLHRMWWGCTSSKEPEAWRSPTQRDGNIAMPSNPKEEGKGVGGREKGRKGGSRQGHFWSCAHPKWQPGFPGLQHPSRHAGLTKNRL